MITLLKHNYHRIQKNYLKNKKKLIMHVLKQQTVNHLKVDVTQQHGYMNVYL